MKARVEYSTRRTRKPLRAASGVRPVSLRGEGSLIMSAPGKLANFASKRRQVDARTPRRHARAITSAQRYIGSPETPHRHRLRGNKS